MQLEGEEENRMHLLWEGNIGWRSPKPKVFMTPAEEDAYYKEESE